MWATECCKRVYFYGYKKALFHIKLEICSETGHSIDPILRNIYMLTSRQINGIVCSRFYAPFAVAVFGYGYLATWVLTEVAKNFVGELRPHFLAVCQPSFDCSAVTTQNAFNRYIQPDTNYTCLNSDSSAVREARYVAYGQVPDRWSFLISRSFSLVDHSSADIRHRSSVSVSSR